MSDLDFYCGRTDGRMDGRTNEAIPWGSCEPKKNFSRISNWSNVKDDDYIELMILMRIMFILMMTKVIKLQAPARNRVQLCSKVRHDPRAGISDKEFLGCNNLGFYYHATTDYIRPLRRNIWQKMLSWNNLGFYYHATTHYIQRLYTTLAQKHLTKNLWAVTI